MATKITSLFEVVDFACQSIQKSDILVVSFNYDDAEFCAAATEWLKLGNRLIIIQTSSWLSDGPQQQEIKKQIPGFNLEFVNTRASRGQFTKDLLATANPGRLFIVDFDESNGIRTYEQIYSDQLLSDQIFLFEYSIPAVQVNSLKPVLDHILATAKQNQTKFSDFLVFLDIDCTLFVTKAIHDLQLECNQELWVENLGQELKVDDTIFLETHKENPEILAKFRDLGIQTIFLTRRGQSAETRQLVGFPEFEIWYTSRVAKGEFVLDKLPKNKKIYMVDDSSTDLLSFARKTTFLPLVKSGQIRLFQFNMWFH